MEIYDEDTLTEFELGRQRNIIRNYEFMKACGLPVKPLVYVKRVHVPLEEQFKYLSESSSDEEWTLEPKKKEGDKNASKSADIRRKVSNPTAFFKKKEKEERELKGKKENKGECSGTGQTPKRKKPKKNAEVVSISTATRKESISLSSCSAASSTLPSVGVGSDREGATESKQANSKNFIRQRPKLPPSSLEVDNNDAKDEDETHTEVKSLRYPRRGPRINYSEAEVPDDDHFLYCEQCKEYYQGECSEHCIIRPIADSSVSNGSKKALSSLPEGMEVRESRIKDAGMGVFATKEFQSGATFGPYGGEKLRADVPKVGLDTSYMWEIVKDLKVAYYINGKNEEHANWMRYVNCSRVEEEQNMVAYQFHGNIFYRVYKDVQPGTEFLVWYGEEYAGELGIALEDQGRHTNDGKFVVYKCDWCCVCYTREDGLTKHQNYCKKRPARTKTKTILEDAGKKKSHVCQVCGKTFSTARYLKQHLLTHTDEKPFRCKQCGKSYTQQHNLNCHLLTHTGERQFICEECGRQFTQAIHLKEHIRTHTGETPYKCDVCGEGFKQNCLLKNHMSKHTGVNRLKCEQCDYETNVTTDLKRHLLTHTGEKPYQCEFCGYRFTHNYSLKRHVKRMHPTG